MNNVGLGAEETPPYWHKASVILAGLKYKTTSSNVRTSCVLSGAHEGLGMTFTIYASTRQSRR